MVAYNSPSRCNFRAVMPDATKLIIGAYARIPYSSFGSPAEKTIDSATHIHTAIAFGDNDIKSRPSKRIAQYLRKRFIGLPLFDKFTYDLLSH